MRPCQRHRASGWTSKDHVGFGLVRQRPDLLGQQFGRSGKALHRPDKGPHIAPRRQLVMPALPSKQRPGVPVSPALVWPAIVPLPIAVMVVPSPAGTEGRIHLEHRVHHAERILDQGIARLADAVADQFKEPRIHNVLGRKRGGRPRAVGFAVPGRRGWRLHRAGDRWRPRDECG